MTLTNKVVSGLSWMMTATLINIVFHIIFLSIMARLILPSEYGVMGAAMIVIGFSTIFTQMGVGPALVQHPTLNELHIRVGFTLGLITGGLFALLVFAVAPLLSAFFDLPQLVQLLRALAAVFVIQGFSLVAESLLVREMKFAQLAIRDVVAYVLGYGLIGVVCALLGYGVWALAYAHLAQATIRTVIILYSFPHDKRPLFQRHAAKELLSYGGGITLAAVFNKIANMADNLIVAKVFGADSLGYYQRAYDLMKAPARMFGLAVEKTLFPALASIQSDRMRLCRAHKKGLFLMALLMLPVSAVMYVLAPDLVTLLLGANWVGVSAVFQVLAFGLYFRLGYKINGSLARATGKVYRLASLQGVYATAIFLGALFGAQFGLSGVAWGVLGALVLHFSLMSWMGIRISGLSIAQFSVVHLPGLLVALVVYLLVNTLAGYMRESYANPLLTLLACMLMMGFIVVLVLLTWFLSSNGRQKLRAFAGIRHRKKNK